ncbi:hypothetical protein ABMA70_01230 [Halobacteriovorax sp. XZX-3]|uniref:hypothetical protein n=1 Tax=unclassified Halobacteriovorax TaxID=2639665 RepID=UPI000CD2588A|nr:hypothetical protein [Halobacteriovorax sp. DA5]POB14381.1 hypothetical protein C0Z22_04620 [Halobacteriovorax sp. DA5]
MATSTKKKVTEYLLTKEQISGGLYEPNEVYFIKDGGKELGPFWQEDLKEFIEEYSLFNQKVFVKSMLEEQWSVITAHPLFQRRRPEIIKEFQVDEDDQFFILRSNKKDGPYKSSEIMAMLDSLELLYTDFISVDNGQSWGTIHEFEVFDRRSRSNESLPESPQGHIFKNSILDADKAIELSKQDSEDREFIYDLAYIGNQKLNPNKASIDDFEQKEKSDPATMFRLGAFAASFVFVFAIFFVFSKMSGTPDVPVAKTKKTARTQTKRTPAAQVQKKPSAKTVTKTSKRREAPSAFKKRAQNRRQITKGNDSIGNADFLSESRQMNDAVMDPADLPPEVIFDDANEALELDPVRERISKETFDPPEQELNNYDELDAAREIVDEYLDRSPAAGANPDESPGLSDEFTPEDAIEGEQF